MSKVKNLIGIAAGLALFAFAPPLAGLAGGLVGTVATRLLTTVAASALMAVVGQKGLSGGTGGITLSSTTAGEKQPETIILGRTATGGTLIAPSMTHGSSNSYLTHVVEICSAPGATLSRLMLNGAYVSLGATPHADYGLPVLGDLEGLAWIKWYDGRQTAADPYLVSKYGTDPDRPWTSAMVGQGICYAILTFKFNREKLTSVPAYRFEVRGVPLYDPRKDSTAGGSGAHRWTNQTTWEQTDNPVVMVYNLKRGIPLPGGEVYGGKIAAADLPTATWFAAMNEADLAVAKQGGGTEAQYRAGIELQLSEQPAAAIEELLKACSGKVADIGGAWKIRVGGPGLPVFAITDDDITVTSEQDFDPFPSLGQTFNGVTATYPDPDSAWETRDAPARYSAELEAQDRFGRKTAALTLPAVPYGLQAQRLMRGWIEAERRFRKHNLMLPPPGSGLEPLDVIAWTSARNGYEAKLFELDQVAEDPLTCKVQLANQEVDPADYSWVPGYELPTSIPSPAITPPAPIVVPDWDCEGIAIKDSAGGDRRPAIKCTWANEFDRATGIKWQVRLAGSTTVSLRGSTQDVEAGAIVIADGVLPEEHYECQGFPILPHGRGSWSPWRPATTPPVKFGMEDLAAEIEDSFREIAERAGVATVDGLPATGEPNQIVFDLETSTLYRWDADAGAWTDDIYAGIAPGAVDITKLAASIAAPLIWSGGSLPTTRQASDVLLWGGKLYRWSGTAYTAEVDAADIDIRVGGSNLLYNSGLLDTSPLGWSAGTGTVLDFLGAGATGFGRAARATVNATATTGTTGVGVAATAGVGAQGGWRPNTEYVVSVYAAGTGAFVGKTLSLSFTGESGFVVTPLENPVIAGTEQRHSFKVVTGATVIGGRVGFVVSRAGLAIGDAISISGAQVETGNVLTGYGPRPGEILPGTITSDALADAAITAQKIADAALTTAKFAAGIEPVGMLTGPSLPTVKTTTAIVWQGELYRWSGTAYVKTVAAADISGAIANAQIAALAASKITGQLTDAQIAAIAAAKLTGQITGTQISDSAISTPKLAAGAVVADTIASNAITAAKIAAEAITAAKIEAGAVTTAKLAAGSVQAGNIASDAVTTAKLAAGAVTADAIATNAITAGKVAAGAIAARELAANAVTATKLAVTNFVNLILNSDLETPDGWAFDTGVTHLTAPPSNASQPGGILLPASGGILYANYTPAGRISVNAGEEYLVGASFRASGSAGRQLTPRIRVTWYDKAGGSTTSAPNREPVTGTVYEDRNASFVVPAGYVQARFAFGRDGGQSGEAEPGYLEAPYVRRKNGGELIVDGAISATKIAALAITTAKLAAGSVTADIISSGAVTTEKLVAGSVEADKLAASAVTADKIATNAVTAGKIATDAITAGKVAAGAIAARELAANAVTASKLAVTAFENLITNADLATGADNWSFDSGVGRTTSLPPNATKPANLQFSDTDAIRYGIWDTLIPVTAGEEYVIGASCRGSGTGAQFTPRLRAQYLDASGAQLSQTTPGLAAVGTSYQDRYIIAAIPTGAAYLRAAFGRYGGVSGEAGAGYMEDMYVRRRNAGELLVDGIVTANKIAAGSVTADAIAASAIIASKIAAGAVTASKINVTELAAISANMGTLTAGRIELNFTAGDNGTGILLRGSDGYAELNNVKIRRQIEVASGQLSVDADEYLSGARVIGTSINISAWGSAQKTYLAVCGRQSGLGMQSLVPGADTWWEWRATVSPRTYWDDSGTIPLRLMIQLLRNNITGHNSGMLWWKLYEVS